MKNKKLLNVCLYIEITDNGTPVCLSYVDPNKRLDVTVHLEVTDNGKPYYSREEKCFDVPLEAVLKVQELVKHVVEETRLSGFELVIEGEHDDDGLISASQEAMPYAGFLVLQRNINEASQVMNDYGKQLLDAAVDEFLEGKLMDFSSALLAIKAGKRVSRAGWNGKGMFIFLVPGSTFQVNRPPLLGIYPEGTTVNYHSHVDMKTADNQIVPWVCSQTDLFADDWRVVG